MYRTDAPQSVPAKPTPSALGTEGYYKAGTASADGTVIDQDHLNMIQESLIAILTDQGIGHSKSDVTRVLQAITAKIAAEAPAEPTATTSVEGVIELADDTEALAGVLGTRAVTPANLGANFNPSVALGGSDTGGYLEIVGTGLLIQWARYIGINGSTTRNLPTAFASATYWVNAGGSAGNTYCQGSPNSATVVNLWSPNTCDIVIIAIGLK